MKNKLSTSFSPRLLPLFTAVTALGFLGTNSASANQWTNGDQDNLWSNVANWTAGIPNGGLAWINGSADEAWIDYAAPSVSEVLIGQGAGDGNVRMKTGGSITTSHINMAVDTGRNGTWFHDDGTLNAGEIRLGRNDGGIATFNLSGGTVTATGIQAVSHGSAGATGIFNMSGGTLNSGHLQAQGLFDSVYGNAQINISGGTVNSTGGLLIGRYSGAEATTATTTITGGAVNLSNHIFVNRAQGNSTATSLLDISAGTLATPSSHDLLLGRGNMTGSATVKVSGTGSLTTRNVDMGLTDSGGTGVSTLEISGGTLTGTGRLYAGHTGGDAHVVVSGGHLDLDGEIRLSDADVGGTADSTFTITGGTVDALQIGIGNRDGTGQGHLIVGGTGTLNTVNHIFLRPGNGEFTVDGSDASINVNRVGGTGFEVTAGSVVNFNADAGGFSAVTIAQSTMRFSADTGEIYIDATDLGVGVYDLFTFAGYFSGDENTLTNRFGTEGITFGAGLTGGLLYNANDIQLEVIPEPSTYAAIFGGIALLGVMIRRRFRR